MKVKNDHCSKFFQFKQLEILRSSSANKFYIKKSRLEIQKRAFSRVGAKIWNEMPASLRELPKRHFQTKLHSFLLDTLKKHDDYIDISQITSALKTYK